MLVAIFDLLVAYISIRLLVWGIKAAWGIWKILVCVVFLPLIIVGIALSGFFLIALIISFILMLIVTIGAFLWV